MNVLCNVDGIVTADELAATVDAIAAVQLADGNIPWTPGDHTDRARELVAGATVDALAWASEPTWPDDQRIMTARPTTSSRGSTPQWRESHELARLSPRTK